MKVRSKKVAMIMVMGLLVAGLVGQIHYATAQMESPALDKADAAVKAAQAAQAQAEKQLKTMMTHMDSMKNMQMSSMEKEMMGGMEQMAMTMKMLLDENKKLIEALRDLVQSSRDKK